MPLNICILLRQGLKCKKYVITLNERLSKVTICHFFPGKSNLFSKKSKFLFYPCSTLPFYFSLQCYIQWKLLQAEEVKEKCFIMCALFQNFSLSHTFSKNQKRYLLMHQFLTFLSSFRGAQKGPVS